MLIAAVALLCFILGGLAGALAMFLFLRHQKATQAALQNELQSATQALMIQQLRDTFAGLAAEALHTTTQQANQQFLALANSTLGTKHQLIDQSLKTNQTEIKQKLEQVSLLVSNLEKQRAEQFGQVSQQLADTSQKIQILNHTTADLKNALTNARTRGQWGERMAADVLRLAGLQPNINYRTQTTNTQEGLRYRPDFTLFLPSGQVLHMDVKFPLDNYVQYLNAPSDVEKANALKLLLANTRQHLKDTAARNYPTTATQPGESSLPYLLLFIPNEQLFAFLLEQATTLIDEALKLKIILCSPTTLIAVLTVIHTATNNFRLQQQAATIQTILLDIREQWHKYGGALEGIGDKIDALHKEYEKVRGPRFRELEKRFAKLDALPTLPTNSEITNQTDEIIDTKSLISQVSVRESIQ